MFYNYIPFWGPPLVSTYTHGSIHAALLVLMGAGDPDSGELMAKVPLRIRDRR